MDDAGRRLRAVVLRQLHVALKTFALYSGDHAVARSVLPGVSATLDTYLRTAGPLTIQVGRDRLGIGGDSVHDGGAASLAYYLYLRNVASIAILPGVSEREVGALMSALSRDRQTLDAIGGIERALAQADLTHIVVTGVTLGHDDPAQNEQDTLTALVNGGRLSADEHELVLDVLRDGPEATARLLTALYDLASQSSRRPAMPALVQALDTLDRTILDEPLEEQDALFGTLARAHLLLDEPLRSEVTRELINQAADGGAARTVVSELNGEEIAQLLLGFPEQEAVSGHLMPFLDQLKFLPDKLSEIVAALQPALAARGQILEPSTGAPAGHTDGQSLEWPAAAQVPVPNGTTGDGWAEVPPDLVELLPGEERALLGDVGELNEIQVMVDSVTTLSNLMYLEDEPEQLVETANLLAGHLPPLAEAGRLDLVASALRVLRTATDRAGQYRAGIEAAIARVLDEGVLDLLIATGLQEADPAAPTAHHALREIAADAVPRIIRVLEREPQAARRRQLCRLLAEVARDDPDAVGMHLPAVNWHLTRNLVFVMGELRSPAGVRHVLRVSRDPDFRVRREVIDALRKIPNATSRTALLGFFDDPEPRIQHHLIETIGAGEDPRVGEHLLRVVQDRDVSPRAIVLKTAAMQALERMRFAPALPVIDRIARARWAFGRNRRALRDAARQVAVRWRAAAAR